MPLLKERSMHQQHDVIIIGGGPAGCAAATSLARYRWNTLIVDRSMAGSFLASLGNVSFFPGFPESISGQELLRRMRRQAELSGAHLVSDAITGLARADGRWQLTTESGKPLDTRVVVIATGAGTRTNYLQGERELLGRGVSSDAMADGPAVLKRAAAVIGKTRHAAEEALALTRFAEHVHFIIPSSKLEADEHLAEAVQKHRAIEAYYSASLKKINGDDHVHSITVLTGGHEKEIPVAGVFTYIHEHRPSTGFLEKTVELAHAGAIKVDRGLATSAPGVFACGDALCGKPQLPVIAASQGVLAGISADKYLSTPA
jgi:thioredoxin reductase (NADPH)